MSEVKPRNLRKLPIIGILFIALFLVATVTFFVVITYAPSGSDDVDVRPSSEGFGNNTIGGSFVADAVLVDANGGYHNEGVRALADMPSIVMNDSFDTPTLDAMWSTYTSGVTLDANQSWYMSPRSVSFVSTTGSIENLTTTTVIPLGMNNTFQTYFWVNITNQLDDSPAELNYFVLKVNFANTSNTLVYVIDGYYVVGSGEQLIDVSSQLTAYNDWIGGGVRITNIEQDYVTQFGGLCPNFAGFTFQFKGGDISEKVHLDEWTVKRTPISETDSYWRNNNYEKVLYFLVIVHYNVTINTTFVNASNCWIELALSIQVENGAMIKIPFFLAQDQLMKVTAFNTSVTWTSKVFALPIDDSVYGNHLLYNFSASAEAFGQLLNTTTWIRAMDQIDGFDQFEVWWVVVNGSINVELYALIGTCITVVGSLGLVIAKRRKNPSVRMQAVPDPKPPESLHLIFKY